MEVLFKGEGALLGWRDPDEERLWRLKNKPRAKYNKVMNLGDAIENYVKPDEYIVFGGMGHVRSPIAAVHEIIRRDKCGFIFGAKIGTFDLDLLLAADCVKALEVTYAFGHEAKGLSNIAKRLFKENKIQILCEWTSASFAWRLKAAASGLPFFPTRILLGSDTLKKSSAIVVKDFFSKKPIVLLPALYPDLSIIHVHKADIYGNAIIEGPVFSDIDLAMASRRVIITAEKIIEGEIKSHDESNIIPYFLVDAVVHVPYGSHPANMPHLYYFDFDHIDLWLEMSKTDEDTSRYLETYIYSTENHFEYLEKIGGEEKLKFLSKLERENFEE